MDRISSLKQMLEQNPGDVFLHYALAMEWVSADNYPEAIEKLEWIRAHHNDYLPLYYQLAQLYEKMDDTDKAVPIYEVGIQVANKQGDQKTSRELRSALDELLF